MSEHYKSIKAFGTPSAFAPATISKSVTADQPNFMKTITQVAVLQPGTATTVNMGNLPENSVVVSSFFKGDFGYTPAGNVSYDVGLASDGTTPNDSLLGTASDTSLVSPVEGKAKFNSPVPVPSGDTFVNLTPSAAIPSSGTPSTITATLVVFCPPV